MGPDFPEANVERPARLIAGKYRLIRPLGYGGMGAVWQAAHLTLHSTVAIKLLEPTIAASAQALQRFLHEARAAAALRSPHVVQILDHGVDEGTPYIVMEQLEGETLAERLERCSKLPPLDTARVVTHIARALGRAHAAGIVHRDLKPDNVFLVSNDDEELAKLLDFGIAKSLHDAKVDSSHQATIPGVLVGTPYYMSPEQAQGAPDLDHRTDIWSLGVIAFECLLGCRPFESSTLTGLLLKIREEPQPIPSRFCEVPAGFDAWFARACARDVERRFETARQAAEELRRLCENEAPPKRVSGGSDATLVSVDSARPPPARSSPRLRALGALLALTGLSLFAVVLARFGAGTTTEASSRSASLLQAPSSANLALNVASATLLPSIALVSPVASSSNAVVVELARSAPKPSSSAPTRHSAPRAVSAPHALTPPAVQPSAAPDKPSPSSTRNAVDLGI